MAHESDAKRICDLWPGSGDKLMSRFEAFETVGIDEATHLASAREAFPGAMWVEAGIIEPQLFAGFDLVICANVLEHLAEPDVLMDALARSDVESVVFSTPERNALLQADGRSFGPPQAANRYFEWTSAEFARFVDTYFDVVGQHVSSHDDTSQLLHARRR